MSLWGRRDIPEPFHPNRSPKGPLIFPCTASSYKVKLQLLAAKNPGHFGGADQVPVCQGHALRAPLSPRGGFLSEAGDLLPPHHSTAQADNASCPLVHVLGQETEPGFSDLSIIKLNQESPAAYHLCWDTEGCVLETDGSPSCSQQPALRNSSEGGCEQTTFISSITARCPLGFSTH